MAKTGVTQAETLVQAILDGHRFSKKLTAHTGIPQSNVYTLLSQLKAKGAIVGNGVTGYYTKEEEEAKHRSPPPVVDPSVDSADPSDVHEPAPWVAEVNTKEPLRGKFTEATQHELVTVCEALLFDKPEWGSMPRALLETITHVSGAAMAATLQTLLDKGIVKESDRGFEISNQALAEELCGYKKPASYPANIAPAPVAAVLVEGNPVIVTSVAELERIRDNAKLDATTQMQGVTQEHGVRETPTHPWRSRKPEEKAQPEKVQAPTAVPATVPDHDLCGMTLSDAGALTLICKDDDNITLSAEETKRVFAFLFKCQDLLTGETI